MPTADSVKVWCEELRKEFPWFENADLAEQIWFESAAMPLRTERWIEPARRAGLDPRKRFDLLAEWLGAVADHLSVPADSIYPTMGTSVSMERVVPLLDQRGPGRYLITADAHRAVMNPLEVLYAQGRAEIVPIDLDAHGRVDLGCLADRLDPKVRAVILTHVSSVTGTCQEIDAAAALVRDHRERTGAATVLVVDGAQAVPRMPVDASGIDIYTFASQKAGGLPGSVVTVGEAGLRAMAPEADGLDEARLHLRGRLSAGTKHVEAVGALAQAFEFLDGLPALDVVTKAGMPSVAAAIGLLRDRLLGRLEDLPAVRVLSRPEDPAENAGLITFRLEGHAPRDVGHALARKNIHVRIATKDAWGNYLSVPLAPRVLPELEEHGGALRASLWVTNSPDDVDRLTEALGELG
jgi:cysteine desulfurase / selenocysteine lyase